MDKHESDLPEVIVLGAAAVDIVARFEEMPRRDSISFADSCETFPGGAGANVATALALLGCKTAFLGKVGDDDGGKLLVKDFELNGVDTRGVHIVEGGRSASCFIPVDGDGNRLIYALGGVALLESAVELNSKLLGEARALYIAEAFPEVALELIRQASDSQPRVFYSPGGVMIWAEKDLLNQVIEKTDTLFVSRAEAEMMTGMKNPEEAIRKVAELGPGVVIVTLGSEGTLVYEDGNLEKVNALKVPEVVDTTGAGDAFAAGVITGYLEGLDWQDAVRLGRTVAAIKIGHLGARGGLPDRETVRKSRFEEAKQERD